jgi:hypothetical protein
LHLGIHYLPTGREDYTNITPANDASVYPPTNDDNLSHQGGEPVSEHQQHEHFRMILHPRSLRKARERIKYMVADGASHLQTQDYLYRFVIWWARVIVTWTNEEIIEAFIASCWTAQYATVGYGLLLRLTLWCSNSSGVRWIAT